MALPCDHQQVLGCSEHVLTGELGLHRFGGVTRRKEIQSPLKALRPLHAVLMNERWVCRAQQKHARNAETYNAGVSRVQQWNWDVRLHSFFSVVMEDRVETFILPSFRESRGWACLRKPLYSSFCSGVKLDEEQQSSRVRLKLRWAQV